MDKLLTAKQLLTQGLDLTRMDHSEAIQLLAKQVSLIAEEVVHLKQILSTFQPNNLLKTQSFNEQTKNFHQKSFSPGKTFFESKKRASYYKSQERSSQAFCEEDYPDLLHTIQSQVNSVFLSLKEGILKEFKELIGHEQTQTKLASLENLIKSEETNRIKQFESFLSELNSFKALHKYSGKVPIIKKPPSNPSRSLSSSRDARMKRSTLSGSFYQNKKVPRVPTQLFIESRSSKLYLVNLKSPFEIPSVQYDAATQNCEDSEPNSRSIYTPPPTVIIGQQRKSSKASP